ncbi:jg2093, partial [Pararge aegeria aegeria]
MFLNDMVNNLSISEILNESKIDANVLDDYLSDPETVHQLQKALDRMERNLAASPPSFTLGK